MAAALWAALRQIEALRTSFIFTMEALKPHRSYFPDYGTELTLKFLEAPGSDIAIRAMTQGTRSSQPTEIDHGVERSSASWGNFENFTTSSMYIRLLGGLEQFEIDALKSLLYYRPLGMTAPAIEYETQDAKEQVVFEKPVMDGERACFTLPPLWTWLSKQALNGGERNIIFKRVYGLERWSPPKPEKNFNQRFDLRNAIAHGRERVDVELDDVLNLYSFVLKSIFHISDQILAKYRLNL